MNFLIVCFKMSRGGPTEDDDRQRPQFVAKDSPKFIWLSRMPRGRILYPNAGSSSFTSEISKRKR